MAKREGEMKRIFLCAGERLGSIYPLMNSYWIPKLLRMDPVDTQTYSFPTFHLPSKEQRSPESHGIGEAVKNVLLSLKKKNRSRRGARIRSYVYQVKRGSFHSRLLFSPLSSFTPALCDSSVSWFYTLFSSPYISFPFLFCTPTITSRASIASLRGPEIPAKRTSRVFVRINFRKRKPVLKDYDRASQKKSNFRMRT